MPAAVALATGAAAAGVTAGETFAVGGAEVMEIVPVLAATTTPVEGAEAVDAVIAALTDAVTTAGPNSDTAACQGEEGA